MSIDNPSPPEGKKRTLNFNQYRRFEHVKRLCDDHNIKGVFAPPGKGLSLQEMAQRLFEDGYLSKPSIEEMLSEVEKSIAKDVNSRPLPETPYCWAWEIDLILSDPKGFPIKEETIKKFCSMLAAWAIQNGLDIREKDGESFIPDDIKA